MASFSAAQIIEQTDVIIKEKFDKISESSIDARPTSLKSLVRAIPDKSSKKRKQKIHVAYNLIGFIPADVQKQSKYCQNHACSTKNTNCCFTCRYPNAVRFFKNFATNPPVHTLHR